MNNNRLQLCSRYQELDLQVHVRSIRVFKIGIHIFYIRNGKLVKFPIQWYVQHRGSNMVQRPFEGLMLVHRMQDRANRPQIQVQRSRKPMGPCSRSAYASFSGSTLDCPWVSEPENINHWQVVWAFMFIWIQICILNHLAHALDRKPIYFGLLLCILDELTRPYAQGE